MPKTEGQKKGAAPLEKNAVPQISDGRREALIAAGLDLFGEYGFKATSTRMLAEKSGANIAAIPYYFGSKQGLYEEVVRHIVQRMLVHMGPLRQEVEAALSGGMDKPAALGYFKRVLRQMAAIVIESDEPKAWAQIIMREQARPTPAFDILYNGSMKHMLKIMSGLVAICTDTTADDDVVKIRVHCFLGQILGLLVSRETLLRHLGVKKLKDTHMALIQEILSAHAEGGLAIPVAKGE